MKIYIAAMGFRGDLIQFQNRISVLTRNESLILRRGKSTRFFLGKSSKELVNFRMASVDIVHKNGTAGERKRL